MIKKLEDREIKYYEKVSEGSQETQVKVLQKFSVYQVDSQKDLKELCQSIKHLDHPAYYNGLLTNILETTGETQLAKDLIVVKSEDYK